MPPEGASYEVGGHRFAAPRPAPGLYLVSTPIGNLKDVTLRALEVLAGADLVLCEDTRHSARLFSHYAIATPRSPLHEHNERGRVPEIVDRLEAGAAIALISDAGTPLVSDPGFPLVRAAREKGIEVFAVPGASALLAGVAAAGLPSDRFSFFGFLPPKSGQRRNAIAALKDRGETLVFYESPRRLAACLADLAAELGDGRPAAVGLELTKRFERLFSGTLADLAGKIADEEQKGEAVILVAGASGPADAGDWRPALEEELAKRPLKEAVAEIAERYRLRRKEVYDEALRLKNG